MPQELPRIEPKRKTGRERFTYNGHPQKNATLREFWRWSSSDVLSNATRGVLAEFIVALSLGTHRCVRSEWDAFDLVYLDRIKIEVKSSAYIQSWFQRKYSTISFGIAPTLAWDVETNLQSTVRTRQADVYVFCLLANKDQSTIDPLDLNQWEFFVLSRTTLDEKLPTSKSIGLKKLRSLDPKTCSYKRLKRYILEEAAK